jgi:hypothetical protein
MKTYMKKKSVPNYLVVFESRLNDLKKRIQREIDKPKKDRERHHLKRMVHEANSLKKAVREAREEHAMKCPHCGKRI